MPAPVVIGVDIGSSALRAAAIDHRGHVVATSSSSSISRESSLPAGELDPAAWIRGLGAALQKLGDRSPLALCIGGQGPTTVADSGVRALTYRHPSGANDIPVRQHAAHAEDLRRRLGPQTQPRLMWDYLLTELGGAAGVQSVWPSTSPLSGFGVPVPVGAGVGVTSGVHGIQPGITLVPGANDALLTAWGCSIDRPGLGFDPGGRSGGLGIAAATGTHRVPAELSLPGHVPDIRIVGGPVASHGAMLEWWSRLTGRRITDLIQAAERVPPGSGGVSVLPFLEGERAPRWVEKLRAEVSGIGPHTDAAVVTRALLESTAYGLAHIAASVAEQGVQLERVVCSGSPSRSDLWTSIKASVLEVPVDVPECTHMAAYGAALCAGSAAGWWPLPGEGKAGDWPTPEVRTFEPEPLPAYREGLRRFILLGNAAEARLRDDPVTERVSGGPPVGRTTS